MIENLKESAIEKSIWLWLDSGGFFPVKYENKASFNGGGGAFFNGVMKRYGISDIMFFACGKVVFCEIKKPEILKKIENNLESVYKFKVPDFPKNPEGKKARKMFLRKHDSIKRYKDQWDFIQKVRSKNQVGFFATSIEDVKREMMKLILNGDLVATQEEIDFFTAA